MSLINGDGVLSTHEQEEVIRYFAQSMRSTNRFVIVVAGLHLLLAVVYLALLFSGSPLISTFHDGSLGKPFDEAVTHLKRLQAYKDTLAQGRGEGDVDVGTGTGTGLHDSHSAEDGVRVPRSLERKRRAADEQLVLDYMSARGGGGGASQLSWGTTLAMLTSSALLCLGGYGCLQAYRAMRLSAGELAELEAQGGAQEARNGSSPAVNGRGNGVERVDTVAEESRATVKEASQSASPRFQYALAAVALIPTVYWLVYTVSREQKVNALMSLMRSSSNTVEAPAAADTGSAWLPGNALEVVLILWQPPFHFSIGRLVATLFDGRAQLVALSRLKYAYEKL